jgi:hypothetical protein
MCPNRLHEDEIKRRIAELFNQEDLSYHPLSIIVHVYKLIRPAPKVSLASIFYVDRIVDKKTSIVIPIVLVVLVHGVERHLLYVSLAPGMDHSRSVEPPPWNM